MKKSAIISLFVVSLISLVSIIIIISNEQAKAWYNYTFKMTHFEKGEKMYFAILNPQNTDTIDFKLLRLITPLTSQDIDSMNIDPDQKQIEKLKLNPNLKPYLIESSDKVSSAGPDYYVGEYLGHDNFPSFADRKMFQFTDVNIIYPNPKKLMIDNISITKK